MRKPRTSGVWPRVSLVVLCCVLWLVGAVAPAAAKKPSGPPTGQEEGLDQFDVAVGRRLYPLALARGGAEVSLGKFGRRVQSVFDDLARAARKQRRLDYSLHVLSSRERLDGWALPDGSVFVTVGLLYRLRSEDEVAGVLAHQLAHAVLRHNLHELTSPEEQALLADIAAGKVPPVREKLGRAGLSLLGEYYRSTEERAADALARGLSRQAGFRESGLEFSFRRLVNRPLPAYLMVHPHPGLKPLPKEAEGPSVIIIEEVEPAWPPPPPPPLVRPVPPLPPPARIERIATPERQAGLSLLAGLYPVGTAESTASIAFKGDFGSTSALTPSPLQTTGQVGGAALGGLVEIPFGRDWEGLFGGGWVTADVFRGRPKGNGGFLMAGVLRRGSVDGEGIRWAAGPYLSLAWMSANAGETTDDLAFDTGDPPEVVEQPSAVTARAVAPALGAMLTVSGDTPRPGIAWFAAVAGQVSNPGAWSYSATAYSTQRTLDLPVSGPNAAPLSATGVMALGGVVFRF